MDLSHRQAKTIVYLGYTFQAQACSESVKMTSLFTIFLFFQFFYIKCIYSKTTKGKWLNNSVRYDLLKVLMKFDMSM